MIAMSSPTTVPTTYRDIPPHLINFDPTQPRQEIDQEAQGELEASVREHGIGQPLMVVPLGDGRYQLLYGERRLRAALVTELPTVPCLVREDAPNWMEALDAQIIENVCRSELRPLELAQSLWRRILGANIAALEEERGDDGAQTEQLLAEDLTPASQIAALEDRLCGLAEVETVAEYFGSGRVRVPRKTILAGYGMASWSESRLKKLFQALDVAPEVQDMLIGIDTSARALRDLRGHPAEAQADIVNRAKDRAGSSGDVNAALRDELAEAGGDKGKGGKKGAKEKQERAGGQARAAQGEDQGGDQGADQDDDQGGGHADLSATNGAGGKTFTPDPALALLTTTGGRASKLITDRPPPARGTTPPVTKVGEWLDDSMLQLESAMEAILHLFEQEGMGRFGAGQVERIKEQWDELNKLMRYSLGEE